MPRAKKATASRLDPAPRPIDGALPYFNVLNKDPDREYVWVYKAAQEYGVEHYSYLGYRIERYEGDNGPRPAMAPVDLETGLPGKPNGTVIESRGNVLMSIDRDTWNQLYQFGTDGVSGQAAADAQQKKMLDPSKQVKDSMRGINPRNRDGAQTFYAESDPGNLAAIPTGEDDG